MKTALLHEVGQPLSIEEVELDGPRFRRSRPPLSQINEAYESMMSGQVARNVVAF